MDNILNKIHSYIGQRIRRKIIISVLVIILIIIGFFDYILLRTASKIIHRQTQQYIEDILTQTSKNIEQNLKIISDLIFYIQIDPTIQQGMIKAFSGKLNEYEKNIVESNIRHVLYLNVLYNDEIKAAEIVLRDDRIAISKTSDTYLDTLVNKESLFSRKGAQVWFGTNPDTQTIVMGAAINSLDTQLPIGYILGYIDENYIKEIFMNIELASTGNVFIIDGNGRVISGTQVERLNKVLEEVYLDQIIESSQDRGFFLHTEGDKDYYIAFNYIEDQDWFLVTQIPVAIYKHTENLFRAILIFSSIALLIFFLAVLVVSGKILQPINQLKVSIKDFGDGNFDARCEVITNDEIGELSRTYNSMVDKINDLIKKVYRQTLLKQQAELESLRMQINPHFFYNTLDTINWMARINGNDEVGDVAKAMGDLMRLTISGPEFITMKDEVKTIHSYFKILKHRFGDTLEFNISIAKELKNLYLPKLIIQPILENALIHGIAEKRTNELGKITISATYENNELIRIVVEDNGAGIEAEKLRLIRAQQVDERKQHVDLGIYNVDRRLKLYFGDQYGVEIKSEVDVGTSVTIVFPASDSDSVQPVDFPERSE